MVKTINRFSRSIAHGLNRGLCTYLKINRLNGLNYRFTNLNVKFF